MHRNNLQVFFTIMPIFFENIFSQLMLLVIFESLAKNIKACLNVHYFQEYSFYRICRRFLESGSKGYALFPFSDFSARCIQIRKQESMEALKCKLFYHF